MKLETMSNAEIAAALVATIEALKVPSKSKTIQEARERNLFALKAESARRIRLGAW